jgi:glycosyltransferase involved in cell wall biosynthesis
MHSGDKMEHEPLVSIIIPTYNSSKTIEKCLKSVEDQTYKNIEIIVFDNYSSDKTIELVTRFDVNVFFASTTTPGGKNLGISKSNGQFLLFVDSDMILEQNVVEECVRLSSNDEEIIGIIIPERSVGSGFWVRVRDFERSFYAGTDIESARFFIKKYVTLVEGYDETIIGHEDSTLPNKLRDNGFNVKGRISSYILHCEEGINFIERLHKARRYSLTRKLYYKKYRKYAKKQDNILRRLDLFFTNGNWKILLRHPVLSVGMLTLKTLEYLFSLRL